MRFLISHRPGQGHFTDSSLVFSDKYLFDFPLASETRRRRRRKRRWRNGHFCNTPENHDNYIIIAYALTMFG